MHKADRAGRHIQPVCFSVFKKVLNGTTHQGGPEAPGRKRKLGVRAVRALDAKRRQLVDRTTGEIEITWADITKKARITHVHPYYGCLRLLAQLLFCLLESLSVRLFARRLCADTLSVVCLLPCVPVCFVASCVQRAYLPHRAHHAP